MIQVYLVSEFGEKKPFETFDTAQDAFAFCEATGWHWEDEDGFSWALDFDGASKM